LRGKKKKKNEIAFVTIEWEDGKFSHNTTFCIEGENASQRANALRNKFISCVQ
jgi:hypothetical protein